MALREVRKLRVVRSYEIIRKVFSGAQAILYKARHRITDLPVAIKVYDFRSHSRQDWEKEATSIRACQHIPGVVRLIHTGETPKYGVIVTEWCPGGSLASLDLFQKDHYLEQITGFLFRTLVDVHSAGITHGDIKPENILIRALPYQGELFALCDFGLARPVGAFIGTMSGTPDFVAPELLARPVQATDSKIDSWMVGILLYESVTGDPPFFHPNISTTYRNIQENPVLFDDLGFLSRPDAKDLIWQLLNKDPKSRPDLSDLLEHPFVEKSLNPPCPPSYARFVGKEQKLKKASLRTTSGSARATLKSIPSNDSKDSSESEKTKKDVATVSTERPLLVEAEGVQFSEH